RIALVRARREEAGAPSPPEHRVRLEVPLELVPHLGAGPRGGAPDEAEPVLDRQAVGRPGAVVPGLPVGRELARLARGEVGDDAAAGGRPRRGGSGSAEDRDRERERERGGSRPARPPHGFGAGDPFTETSSSCFVRSFWTSAGYPDCWMIRLNWLR